MGSPDIKLIPTDFGVDMDVDATVNTSSVITGDRNAPIAMRIEPLDVTTTLRGDPGSPVTANAGVELDLRNLPHLTFDQITELLRTITLARSRIRFPVNMNVGLSVFPLTLLGIDAVSFSMCGEPAVIRDDCVPECEEPCVEIVERPPKPKG